MPLDQGWEEPQPGIVEGHAHDGCRLCLNTCNDNEIKVGGQVSLLSYMGPLTLKFDRATQPILKIDR